MTRLRIHHQAQTHGYYAGVENALSSPAAHLMPAQFGLVFASVYIQPSVNSRGGNACVRPSRRPRSLCYPVFRDVPGVFPCPRYVRNVTARKDRGTDPLCYSNTSGARYAAGGLAEFL